VPAGSRLGLEATGGYHEPVAELAYSLGFTVYILNPKDVHFYARALGARGKTDRLDAQIIAAYVAEHCARLHPFTPLSADEKLLRELARRRATLVNAKSMLQQSLRVLPGFEREGRELLRAMGSFADRLERKLAQIAARSSERATLVKRLQTIDGVGTRSPAFVAQRSSPVCHFTVVMRWSPSLDSILDPTIPASTAVAGV